MLSNLEKSTIHGFDLKIEIHQLFFIEGFTTQAYKVFISEGCAHLS